MLKLLSELFLGCAVGVGAMLARNYWLNRCEERMIDAFIQEENNRIIRIFELMLVGITPEDALSFVAPSPVEPGVAIMQLVMHEDEQDLKIYARADGLTVSLINFQEFAAIASYELVKAIPCVEDMDSDDFWDENEDDEDYEEIA